MKSPFRFLVLYFAIFASTQALASSGGGLPAERETAPSGLLTGRLSGENIYQRARSGLVLYENPSNPWVQSVALMAQLQVQYGFKGNKSPGLGSIS